MQASVKQRSLGMVMREKDEDLVLFRELGSCDDEKNDLHLLRNGVVKLEASFESNHESSQMHDIAPSEMVQKKLVDEFLNSGNDKSDYDWLLIPPGTPFLPSLEREPDKVINKEGKPSNRPVFLKSGLANSKTESPTRNSKVHRDSTFSPTTKSTNAPLRWPSSFDGRTTTVAKNNKLATPIGRPTSTTTASRTCKPLRSPTPTSRATLSSTKPKTPPPPVKSSTRPRSTARSSTPRTNTRPSFLTVKSATRSSTPAHQPSALSSALSNSSSAPTSQSSSVTKLGPTIVKHSVPSRGTSPSMRSRPLTATKMPGSSNSAPNQRTTLPDRPASASRCRPVAVSGRISTTETASTNERQRRQSCSPSRGQNPVGNGLSNRSSVHGIDRARSNMVNDDLPNPVLMGSKMVERVINMRRLAPPKQDSPKSINDSSDVKSSSMNSSGFGRSLSKKSLDMAMRHMVIERRTGGKLRPLATNTQHLPRIA